jgi:predicted RNA binding protein YcfA (HicA-like mRNA interferase family)
MGKKEKLFEKAKNSAVNLRFEELCSLAEMVGFIFRNQNGDHKIYKHKNLERTMNFQSDKHDKSKAKRYQIKQLINFIEEFKLIGD